MICQKCNGSGLFKARFKCFTCDGTGDIAEALIPIAVESTAKAFAAFNVAQEVAKATGSQMNPKIRTERLVFKPGKTFKAWSHTILVLNPEADFEHGLLGRITPDDMFHPTKFWTSDFMPAIQAFLHDPHAAAVGYGRRFGTCAICGRTLTNHESIEFGIGPICSSRMGWGQELDKVSTRITIDPDKIDMSAFDKIVKG